MAFRYELQHFPFLPGQFNPDGSALPRAFSCNEPGLNDEMGHHGTEIVASRVDLGHGLDHVSAGYFLGQIAPRAGRHRLLHHGFGTMQAQHDDLRGRDPLEQFSGGFDSVHVGHGDIEDEYIGGTRPGRLERFQAVGSLADDYDILSASFDRQVQPVPDHRMIIGNDNANGPIADCGLRTHAIAD